MKFLVGDLVRVKAVLLESPLAAQLGDKAEVLVGREGVVLEDFPLAKRPLFVGVLVGEKPVFIRLWENEVEPLAQTDFVVRFVS